MKRWLPVMLAVTALTFTGCNKKDSSAKEDTAAETSTGENADTASAADDTVKETPAETEAAAPADNTAVKAPAETAPVADAAVPVADSATPAAAANTASAGTVTLPGGTKYTDTQVGTGKEAVAGSTVAVFYTGTLTDGTKFDSNVGGKPFQLTLGQTPVIQGWTDGLVGMKVGGHRQLTIPPDQAYGAQQKGPIPANSTLLFDVELVSVK